MQSWHFLMGPWSMMELHLRLEFSGQQCALTPVKGIVGLVTDTRVIRDRNMIDGKGINLFVRGCVEDVGEVVDKFEKALPLLRKWREELA